MLTLPKSRCGSSLEPTVIKMQDLELWGTHLIRTNLNELRFDGPATVNLNRTVVINCTET
jgi:hypothetical protein